MQLRSAAFTQEGNIFEISTRNDNNACPPNQPYCCHFDLYVHNATIEFTAGRHIAAHTKLMGYYERALVTSTELAILVSLLLFAH